MIFHKQVLIVAVGDRNLAQNPCRGIVLHLHIHRKKIALRFVSFVQSLLVCSVHRSARAAELLPWRALLRQHTVHKTCKQENAAHQHNVPCEKGDLILAEPH